MQVCIRLGENCYQVEGAWPEEAIHKKKKKKKKNLQAGCGQDEPGSIDRKLP